MVTLKRFGRKVHIIDICYFAENETTDKGRYMKFLRKLMNLINTAVESTQPAYLMTRSGYTTINQLLPILSTIAFKLG